jgi:FkbM family methyltransferase
MLRFHHVYAETISVEKGFYCKVYDYLANRKYKKPFSYLHYFVSVVYRRVLFSLASRGLSIPILARFGDKPFVLNGLNAQTSSAYFSNFKPCYEPEVQAAICVFLPLKGFFVDVGSNWGHHALTAVSRRSAYALLIEPNPYVFREILAIRRQLNLEERLSAINCAVGDREGVTTLHQVGFESGVASTNQSFLASTVASGRWFERWVRLLTLSRTKKFEVDSYRLDEILKTKPSPDVVKIDVEGSELSALNGFVETIASSRPAIIFEAHTSEPNSRSVVELLHSFGYMIFRLIPHINENSLELTEVRSLKPDQHLNLAAIHVTKIAY